MAIELIIKDKNKFKKRFSDMAIVQILKVPEAMAGEPGHFQIAISPKDMFVKFYIDPDALKHLNSFLMEYVHKHKLRGDNVSLFQLQIVAGVKLSEFYEKGLCEFENQKEKILSS